jgi:5-formyltetrahydrofolate cyclo-ligase
MADTIEKLKSVFRENVKKQRAQVTPDEAEEASNSLWIQLKEETFFKKARRIAAFCSIGTEIDTMPLLAKILNSSKELYLPKTEQDQNLMEFHSVSDLKKLIPGPFNILEPPAGKILSPKKIDIILVPGLAFDNRGHRLGYGRGYYDRYLNLLKPGCVILGVAYSFQIIDKTPITDHDIPVNAVLTEKYILLC